MARPEDDDSGGEPPCFLHELDPAVSGIVDEETARDVARWRKGERARLLALRQAVPVASRSPADAAIAAELTDRLGDTKGLTVALYWPFKGEPDLRGWAAGLRAGGTRTCLPVVVAKAAPLIFRDWTGAEKLERGVWNIPIPPEIAAEVIPDVVISPVVGFDRENYRLGYGGGFYDRTLAKLRSQSHRPRVIGVGYAFQRIATIFPQPYDVALDEAILTDP
ncbi:MAG: 5-formyltetrahydrofolate cyclo-ligase [Proteobacteria bacterium]|nr:5-formyltetrahydrofolate cyclo-ligase [Pseudomonadota bacterium]